MQLAIASYVAISIRITDIGYMYKLYIGNKLNVCS